VLFRSFADILNLQISKAGQRHMTNFLFIIADQLRADYLGCTGHPVLKTPNIDRIAARGRLFERCYVANPVCMPNRAALMTGRHSSINGVRHNGISLPLEANTFADVLRAGGYDTALFGKCHHQSMVENPPELGPNPSGKGPLANATRRPAGNYRQEQSAEWAQKGSDALERPYYGFDHLDLLTNHGDGTGAAHEMEQRQKFGGPDKLRGPANQLPHTYTCPQAVRTAVPEDQYSTFWIRDKATAYLSDPVRRDTPFFAFVSFPDPHHPFTPPGKYWEMYDPDDMVLPDSFHNRSENPPPHLKWLYENGEIGQARYGAALVSDRQAREAIALTCGMIAMIDDAVGSILDMLEAQGLAEDTVVVFTSDHGDFMADHGMILKGPMHFQSTIRVPLIWADPLEKTPSRTTRLASTVDLSSTILARAGLTPYCGIQGIDLNGPDPRQSVLVEDDGNRVSLGFEAAPRLRTLVTGQYRLTVYCGESWGELYDLKTDPGEVRNLWDSTAHEGIRNDLMFRLTQEMMAACDRSPWPETLA